MKRALALAFVFATAAVACAPGWKSGPHDRLFQRDPPRKIHPPPARQPHAYWWERAEKTTFRPLGRALSPGRYVSAAAGGRDAVDVNAFGQVPDSAWFENRIGRSDISEEMAVRGPARGLPATGTLHILSFELHGASPRFVVRDSEQQIWLVKADPPAYAGMSTSAEIISSRLLWLAGYHVPEMHILEVQVSRFSVAEGAWTRDRYGQRTPMKGPSFRSLLAHLNPNIEGTTRVLITRHPTGVGVGPFSFRGKRLGDPNDELLHEHRRSLRGLWLFFAWINNTDARGKNTLDVHVPQLADGRGVLRHYLSDFSDAFGAAEDRPKDVSEGWTSLVDWGEIGANLVMLGLRYPDWQHPSTSNFIEVGLFGARGFDPERWKPRLPNPAFEERTDSDLFWAGSILARIEARHIRAAVSAGQYRQPGAAEYVVKTLVERRKKLLRYAFSGYLPLDRPTVVGTVLRFDDLRPQAGIEATALGWRVRWNRTRGPDVELASGVVQRARVELGPAIGAVYRRRGFAGDPFVTVTVAPVGGGPELSVHLRVTDDGTFIVPVGLER